jgi:hypothetical protein
VHLEERESCAVVVREDGAVGREETAGGSEGGERR